MKELVFYVLTAAGCAWVTVWLLLQGDAAWGMHEWIFFPSLVDFIHSYEFSVKKVLFYTFFVCYLLTGMHRPLGRFVLKTVIWIIVLMLAILIIVAAYHFILWLAGTL